MADERETPEQKNRRLNKMLHEALDELFDQKIGKQSFGESRLVVVWKDGKAEGILIEDSASIR